MDSDKAFQKLRVILISMQLVYYPQLELPYILITNACQRDAKFSRISSYQLCKPKIEMSQDKLCSISASSRGLVVKAEDS
jgi:hypothetical protein